MSPVQFEAVFSSFPDAVIVCDQMERILQLNAAALELFEVSPERLRRGMPCSQFFRRYTLYDEQQHPVSPQPWSLDLLASQAVAYGTRGRLLILGTPSGRKIFFNLSRSSLLDLYQKVIGTLFIFHEIEPRYLKALRIQHVYEAVQALKEAIAHIPENLPFPIPEETFLFSPLARFVAQQLVDVIRQVLGCWRVSLIASDPEASYLSYVVGSGFTAEQEQKRREMCGCFLYSEFIDEATHARLRGNREVILATDRVRIPPGFPADLGAANLLAVPLFLEQQFAGVLIIFKEGWDSGYTQEEVELVRAVAAEAMLVLEYLGYLQQQAELQVRMLVQNEVIRLTNDFLTLAVHELRTPLTGIKGNMQLAQRRLEALKGQIAEQFGHKYIEQAEQSLTSATQSARLQERMIQDLIDDARIQGGTFTLSPRQCELLDLVRTALTRQQRSSPERVILLDILSDKPRIPIFAEPERIIQVLTIYLANALACSSVEQPVTVQVQVEEASVRVSVHGDGPEIPVEEQGHLWERFYRGKGSSVQHELDLSGGLGFYLCKELIERQHGSVGMQSDPERGTTFWFVLPVSAFPE